LAEGQRATEGYHTQYRTEIGKCLELEKAIHAVSPDVRKSIFYACLREAQNGLTNSERAFSATLIPKKDISVTE
jgi:hypothetical protein